MAKVITFSRAFPKYHPKAGEPTYFVEKFLNSVGVEFTAKSYLQKLLVLNTKNIAKGKLSFEDIEAFYLSLNTGIFDTKNHTIRNGLRFKAIELFSPRVWSQVPYDSPQIIFWDDTMVEKTWGFEMKPAAWWDECQYSSKDFVTTAENLKTIAANDGLTLTGFAQWFAGKGMMNSKRKPFNGQIICWNKDINY